VFRELGAPGPLLRETLTETIPQELRDWLKWSPDEALGNTKWQFHNWQFALIDDTELLFGNLFCMPNGANRMSVHITLPSNNALSPLLQRVVRIGGHVPDTLNLCQGQVEMGSTTEMELIRVMIRDSTQALFIQLGAFASHASTENRISDMLVERFAVAARRRQELHCIFLISETTKQASTLIPFALQWRASVDYINSQLRKHCNLSSHDIQWLNSRVLIAQLPAASDAVYGTVFEADHDTTLISSSCWSDFSFGASRCAEASLMLSPSEPLWPAILKNHGFVVQPIADIHQRFLHTFHELRSHLHLRHYKHKVGELWLSQLVSAVSPLVIG
jgi:hypothetical protein